MTLPTCNSPYSTLPALSCAAVTPRSNVTPTHALPTSCSADACQDRRPCRAPHRTSLRVTYRVVHCCMLEILLRWLVQRVLHWGTRQCCHRAARRCGKLPRPAVSMKWHRIAHPTRCFHDETRQFNTQPVASTPKPWPLVCGTRMPEKLISSCHDSMPHLLRGGPVSLPMVFTLDIRAHTVRTNMSLKSFDC